MKTQKLIVGTIFFAVMLLAQLGTCQTGTPPFSSASGGPDAIDLGNLNIHFAVPFLSKAGRGLPLSYSMSYDSLLWSPVSSSGQSVWTAMGNYGWRGNTEAAMGYVSYKMTQGICYAENGSKWYNALARWTKWVYHDQFGTPHSFNGQTDSGSDICYPTVDDPSFTAVATDGSGYTLIVTNYTDAQIVSPAGFVTTPPVQDPSGSGTATDRNGNQLSTTGTTVADTLGTAALVISGAMPTLTYTFQTTGNYTNTVTVTYTSYTLKTAFNCSGISEATISGAYLPTSITRSDGAVSYTYQFAYEQTPGYGTSYTTGRIQQVTLPTGGTIAYTYTNGNFSSGASNGIVCADGTTAGLTRTLSAGTSEGSWTYNRAGSSPAWNTTVTDPAGNDTYLQFSGLYETERDVYSGHVSGGTLLQTLYTCYNGASYPCNGGGAPSMPPTRLTVTTAVNGYYRQTDTTFDAYVNPLVAKEYDFGSGSKGGLLRETDITYTTIGNIANRPSDIIVKNGSGTKVAETQYVYDGGTLAQTSGVPGHDYTNYPYTMTARGNPTTISQWVSGSTYISTTNTYNDLGVLLTTTDPLNHLTQFSYADNYSDNTNHNTLAFVTQVTYPNTGVAHVVSMKYDWPTGLLVTSTDQNSQATSYTYDTLLRRLTVAFPDSGKTFYTYPNTQQVKTQQLISGSSCTGSNCAESWMEVDRLGRPSRTARANGGESGGSYDQADACYSPTQMTTFASYPYQGGGIGGSPNGTRQCGTGDTSAYDALGRISSVTHSTDTAHPVSYAYYGRAMSVQDEGNGSGTSVTHVYHQDGLGRTTSVCEVAGFTAIGTGGSPANCGLDLSGSGFTTTSTYDPLGNVLTVSQGSLQQRTMTYDGLSHLLTEFIPEANSTTTYNYNLDGTLHQRSRPSPNQTGTYTTTTTYLYDALRRALQLSYSDSNPSPPYSTPETDLYYDEASVWGATLLYPIGRLTHAFAASAPLNAAAIVSYDQMGRIKKNWQCTPYNCATYTWLLSYDYNLDGTLQTATNGAGVTFTYGYNTSQRLTSMTSSWSDANHPATLFSTAHYNAYGQMVSDTLGNNVNESATLDGRGRLSYLSAVNSGSSTVYSLNSAGTPVSYAPNSNITGANDSANGSWSYAYDSLNRIGSAVKSGGVSLTFSDGTYGSTIDRNANLWKQDVNGGSPAPNNTVLQGTNQISGNTYDAAGNVWKWNDGSTLHTYTYDAEGRLVSMDAGSVQYTYDAFGRRVEKNVSGTKDEYLYDLAGNIVADMSGANGGWIRGEIWAQGRHLATYANSTTYFAHQDWLGTERVRTDVSGNVAQSCTSNPYGESLSCSPGYPTTYSPYNLAGMEYDAETGFYHTLFRYYNPRLGSWMTPDPGGLAATDPFKPQSLNRYAYALNTPTTLVDPLGLNVADPDGGLRSHSGFGFGNCYMEGMNIDCATAMGPNGMWGADSGGLAPNGFMPDSDGNPHWFELEYTPGSNGFSYWYPNTPAWLAETLGLPGGAQLPAHVRPSNLPPGTPERYWDAFLDGFAEAVGRARHGTCSTLYGGRGEAALNAEVYRFAEMRPGIGGSTAPGFVNLNPNIFLNPSGSLWAASGTTQVRGFILLHELGHRLSSTTGFFDNDAGWRQTVNNLRLSHACY